MGRWVCMSHILRLLICFLQDATVVYRLKRGQPGKGFLRWLARQALDTVYIAYMLQIELHRALGASHRHQRAVSFFTRLDCSRAPAPPTSHRPRQGVAIPFPHPCRSTASQPFWKARAVLEMLDASGLCFSLKPRNTQIKKGTPRNHLRVTQNTDTNIRKNDTNNTGDTNDMSGKGLSRRAG